VLQPVHGLRFQPRNARLPGSPRHRRRHLRGLAGKSMRGRLCVGRVTAGCEPCRRALPCGPGMKSSLLGMPTQLKSVPFFAD
jgi:hypothetical protein